MPEENILKFWGGIKNGFGSFIWIQKKSTIRIVNKNHVQSKILKLARPSTKCKDKMKIFRHVGPQFLFPHIPFLELYWGYAHTISKGKQIKTTEDKRPREDRKGTKCYCPAWSKSMDDTKSRHAKKSPMELTDVLICYLKGGQGPKALSMYLREYMRDTRQTNQKSLKSNYLLWGKQKWGGSRMTSFYLTQKRGGICTQ